MNRIFTRLFREWQFWCVLILPFLVYLFAATAFVEEAREQEYLRWMNGIYKYDNMSELREQIDMVHGLVEQAKVVHGIEPEEIAALENREAILNYLYDEGLKYEQTASGNLGGAMMERMVFFDSMTTIVFIILLIASAMFLFIIHTWGNSNATCVMEYIIQTRRRVFFDELKAYCAVLGGMTIFLSIAIALFCSQMPLRATVLVFSFGKNVTGISPAIYSFFSGAALFVHLIVFCSFQFFLSHIVSKREASFLLIFFVPFVLLLGLGKIDGKFATLLSPSPMGVISGEASLFWYLAVGLIKVCLSVLLVFLAFRIHSKKPLLPDSD